MRPTPPGPLGRGSPSPRDWPDAYETVFRKMVKKAVDAGAAIVIRKGEEVAVCLVGLGKSRKARVTPAKMAGSALYRNAFIIRQFLRGARKVGTLATYCRRETTRGNCRRTFRGTKRSCWRCSQCRSGPPIGKRGRGQYGVELRPPDGRQLLSHGPGNSNSFSRLSENGPNRCLPSLVVYQRFDIGQPQLA